MSGDNSNDWGDWSANNWGDNDWWKEEDKKQTTKEVVKEQKPFGAKVEQGSFAARLKEYKDSQPKKDDKKQDEKKEVDTKKDDGTFFCIEVDMILAFYYWGILILRRTNR